MPYELKRFETGFKVCDKRRCFSNKPLSFNQAQKQRVAIAISESRKSGKPIGQYFK